MTDEKEAAKDERDTEMAKQINEDVWLLWIKIHTMFFGRFRPF